MLVYYLHHRNSGLQTQNASRSSSRGFILEDPHLVRSAFASVPTIIGICSFFKLCRQTLKTSRKICEDHLFSLLGDRLNIFFEDFFFGEHLGQCPWFLALASKIPVLGLERFCPRKGCPWLWPWPRIFLFPWFWPRASCP